MTQNTLIFILLSGIIAPCVAIGSERVVSLEEYLKKEMEVDVNRGIYGLHNYEYYIIASQKDTAEELVGFLLNSEVGDELRNQALGALGSILAAYPAMDLDRELENIVTEIEGADLSQATYQELASSYRMLALAGTENTLKLLTERASLEYWGTGSIPTKTVHLTDPTTIYKWNALYDAINALGRHPSSKAGEYLKKIAHDSRYTGDPVVIQNDIINHAIASRQDIDHYQHKIAEALALKESIHGKEKAPEIAKEPTAEIPAITPDTLEVTEVMEEEVVPPKSETEEHVEADTTEPSAEPAEKPSQWWFWLIGAVIVVGGIGLITRRKS